VLTYPVSRGPLWVPQTSHGGEDGDDGRNSAALDDLLGPTRAAVLRCLNTRHTTTALATRVRVSVSAASRHATTLCRAGLIDTERRGNAVLHSRTALGTALVQGA
jgi:DNA-binding MarR family transcriptional regulator